MRGVARNPREKGNFVDRTNKKRAAGFASQIRGGRSGKRRKALDKFSAENIQIIRITVMKQIPDDLNAGILHCPNLIFETRKIIDERLALDEMPANAVARRS